MKWGINRRFVVVTIALILVIATLVIVVLSPWNSPLSAHDILDRVEVRPSADGAITCRIQDITREVNDGKETVFNTEISYSSPDHIHYLRSTDNYTFEYITLGDIRYQRQTGEPSEPGNSVSIICTSNTSFEQTLLELVENFDEVERLPDEEVSDTLCYHIQGNYVSFSLQEHLEQQSDRYSEEEIHTILENIGQDEIVTVQIWINKKRYSLEKLQMESNHQSGHRQSSLITTYYDFGESIRITAPLDENGDLLLGWHISDDASWK